MNPARISALYRYPIKGFSPQKLSKTSILTGEPLPFDRVYAVENGGKSFDPINPAFLPKQKFLQLMTNEQIATLETVFNESSQTVKILRDGKQVAAGNLSMPIGRQLIEQFLSAYLKHDVRGTPRIVSSQGHHFADVPDNFISLINLASVRDLERVIGRPVDPLRFRGNIYVEGWEPWFERSLPGRSFKTSTGVTFQAIENITRCAATNVDPESGSRDMQVPRTLREVFSHDDCGVYLIANSPGEISTGDEINVLAGNQSNSAGDGLGIR